jgi:hypothetical protein
MLEDWMFRTNKPFMMIVATGMRAAALPQRVNTVSPVARLSHVILLRLSHVIPLQFVLPLQQLLVTPPLTQVVVIPLTQARTLTHHAAPLIMPVMQRWITVVAHPVAAHAPAHLRPRRAAVATTGLRSSKRTPTQLI